MLPVREPHWLCVTVLIILITKCTEPFEVGGIKPEMHVFALDHLHVGRAVKKNVKRPLECVNGQPAVAAQRAERLPFRYPFPEPHKTVLEFLFRVVPSEKHFAGFTLEPLFAGQLTPANHIQTAACPAPLFFVVSIQQKSLVKRVSPNS